MSTDSLPQSPGVYLITCTANGKTYVGSSQDIRKRINQHWNDLTANRHYNPHLQRAWNKYGEFCFTAMVIEICSCTELLSREKGWLEQYGAGNYQRSFNVSINPTAPMKGLKHKPDTLERMAASQTGRKHSEETKAKISMAHKGRLLPKEQIEKIRLKTIGRKASEETKRKLSIAHSNPSDELRFKMGSAMRGKKRTPESIAKYIEARSQEFIVTTPDGVEMLIKGLGKFCRENNLDQGSMSKIVKTNGKHKGWKCRRP